VGWGLERVEASVRKRFPGLSILTAAPARSRDSRGEGDAQVLIGPAAILRGRPAGSLGCVGFVALDALLRRPDFRAGELAFQSLWAATEAVGGNGRVIVQTLLPEHHAIHAVVAQDRRHFYRPEIKFRAELGYPPFRRLCAVSVTGATEAATRALIDECARRLQGIAGLDVYPAARRGAPGATRPRWSLIMKGPATLPELIREPLRPFVERRRRGADIIDVEMDPTS
jgi:primosomal protein N' (replication factor Y)